MVTASKDIVGPGWAERRLRLPAYRYGEAARFAQTTLHTITHWRRLLASAARPAKLALDSTQAGTLSFLELIEVALVADLRSLGATLGEVRQAHLSLQRTFQDEHPFALAQFKTDGARALGNLAGQDPRSPLRRTVSAADGGDRPTWPDPIQARLAQFDYEHGLAVRWYLRGRDTPIVIDPAMSFGAPVVAGTGVATWVVKERFEAGEAVGEIAEDFAVSRPQVKAALAFEGITPAESHAA